MTENKSVARAAPSAMATLAHRLGVDASRTFMDALRDVAFGEPDTTNEQLMALVVVANQYGLNPFTRELYAFPDRRTGGIVPIVSVDGWYRILNSHPEYEGLQYYEGQENGELYGEVKIFRRGRVPTTVREYLHEVKRGTDPWRQHTHRMLRHRTIMQGARLAFGFAGIYDKDEAEAIRDAAPPRYADTSPETSGTKKLAGLLATQVTEPEPEPVPEPEPDADEAALGADLARAMDEPEKPPTPAPEPDSEPVVATGVLFDDDEELPI